MSRSGKALVLVSLLTFFLAPRLWSQQDVVIGANVNMVSGAWFPDGDPFQRQQNEPSVAFSSRNSLHLLSGANDYRAVDVPGLPGGRETGDSWLSYFWSTNGGATWKSTLIPGYPQDPACDGSASEPTLCGYAAGADPVVRAGVNGMFYYSGIVFDRADPSRSAIFVSRFIDLNNDEGGDPIRYLDTVLLDTNDDGAVFLDKSWIGVDIPGPGAATKALSVVQRDGSSVPQTVECGNIYVGYAGIGGEGQDLRSEIRLATSTDCGDTWTVQLISEPDSLNQGANLGIDPMTGDVHVVWRRFDTVETFLGIPAAGCPADPSSWEVSEVWPVSSITVGGVTYTMEEAQDLLATKHKGDETYKVAYQVIAAKLNLLTGGGDPAPGFNPNLWGQQLSALIADADAWLVENPVGSDPKQGDKHTGLVIKEDIQEILLGSGVCTGGGTGSAGGSTGQTNAILVASSNDGGQTFSSPVEIDESSTFDQGSTTFSFRTTAYPTVTVDATGRVYAAWAARGFAADADPTEGDARIVVSTSGDGVNWSAPYAVDEPNRPGHQIKPSLLFAGGQLTLVYYDFRGDVSNIFESFVVDLPEPDRLRHTVDVRVATALPAPAPVFADYSLLSGTTEPTDPSAQASRYKFLTSDFDEFGGANEVTMQAEYMPPNYPMFADGTTPFIGDYVDVAAPNLIFEEGQGWRFATDPGDVNVWQAVWSDNRDVIPPPDGDWSKYVAPIGQAQVSLFDPTVTLPSCNDVIFTDAPPQWQSGSLYTGTRNQNVYSASITQGLIVAAPGNNRPLVDGSGSPLERGFVVFVQNATNQERVYQLSVVSPADVGASFVQGQSVSSIQVIIPPYSSAAETVFALSTTATPTTETIRVDVTEVAGTLAGSVLLNSDPTAPDPLSFGGTSLLNAEVHNPAILNPAILNPAILNPSADPSLCTSDPTLCVQNPAILNPAILNPAILNPAIFNPAILNPAILNPAILNPAIFNPAILNPAIFNPAILNPAILNPAIFNPAIFNPAILNPAILNPAILNPAIMNPAILNPAILNPAILNPAILNPAIMNPAILNPAILNTTASDSGQVDVTFSVRNDGNATTAYDLNLAAQQLTGLDYQVLVYSLNETPTTDGCTLTTEAQQHLIFVQDNPLSTPLDGTFYLEPGEEVLVTFRVAPDTNSPTPGDPVADFDVADLGGQVTSQPTNTGGAPQPPDDQFGTSSPAVSSTFDSDADGWTIINDGGGWVSSGGNPGGYLEGQDSGGASSTAWYFSAPAKFTGDQSAYYGGTVTYELQQSDPAVSPTSVINDQPYVVLRGGGLVLVYDAANQGVGATRAPGTTWTPFAVPLDAADPLWHVATDGCWTQNITLPSACSFSGPTPSVAQFVSVLSAMDTLLIRGEYSVTLDTGGLDNPTLVVSSGPPVTAFTETVITSDTDILNDGILVVANDLGGSPSAVTVNGVAFGTDQGGLIGPWGPGGGDFSTDPLSANLDALLSDLQFSGTLSTVSFTAGGLTPGSDYRLQLLFSNDVNSTGDRVEVTIEGETWILDDWQPGAVNLSFEFTATSSSVMATFAPGAGSDTQSGRAVLNAYVLHELIPPPVIVNSITEPIRPGIGYVTLAFDPGSPLPASWQALGWQILADDGSVFGPQNLWGFTGTRLTFRSFSTRLPAGADVPGGVYLADAGGNPVSNQFPVTFSQTPGAPVIEAAYSLDNAPSFCGGGAFNLTLLSDFDSAPAGTWLAVDIAGVDTSAGGVPVFDGVDTPLTCGVTTGGANANLRKYVQVPAGVPVGSYTLEWRAGTTVPSNLGPPSAARTFTN